jgi:hypothetical protein
MPPPNTHRRILSTSAILGNNTNNYEIEAAQHTVNIAQTQHNAEDVRLNPRIFLQHRRLLPWAQTRVRSPNVLTSSMNAGSRILSEGPPAHTLTPVVNIPNQGTETTQHTIRTSFHSDTLIANNHSSLHIPEAVMFTQAASVPDNDNASAHQIVDDLNGTNVNPATEFQGEIVADDIAQAVRPEAFLVGNGFTRTLNDAETTAMNEFVYNVDSPRDSFASAPTLRVLTDDPVDGAARTLTEADRNIIRGFGDDELYSFGTGLFDDLPNDLERSDALPHEDLPNRQPTSLDFNIAEALRTLALNHYPPEPFQPPVRSHGNEWSIYDDESLWNVNHDDTIMEGIRPIAARALLAWTKQHLEPLALTQPNYPLESDCLICHDPFILNDPQHTPVLLKDIEGCAGHVFCNTCITNWLTSGQENANTCPLCRSELMELDAGGNLLPLIKHVEEDEERSRTGHTLTQAEREAEEVQDVVRHHQPYEELSRPIERPLDEDNDILAAVSLQVIAVVVLGIVFLRYILDKCILGWDEYKRFSSGMLMGVLVGVITAMWLGRRRSR